jgi:hypothetical protein
MRPILVIIVLIAVVATGLDIWWRRSPLPSTGDFGLEAQEKRALAAGAGLVWRDGTNLDLRIGTGAVVTFTDHTLCGDIACPAGMAIGYRYLGWDSKEAGYRLAILRDGETEMVLPFADGSTLEDAAHPSESPTPGAPLPNAPPALSQPDSSLVAWQSDVAAARADEEKPLIAAAGGAVSRDSLGLRLTLGNGQHALFSDDVACGQIACPQSIYRSFSFGGQSPDKRYFVLVEHFEESNAAFLIDAATGAATALIGPPFFSPDGKRVASAISDLETPSPLRLQILSLAGSKPEPDFDLNAADSDDTIYRITGWDDADHLRLSERHWTSKTATETMLVHDAAAWRLEAPDPGN